MMDFMSVSPGWQIGRIGSALCNAGAMCRDWDLGEDCVFRPALARVFWPFGRPTMSAKRPIQGDATTFTVAARATGQMSRGG
jgi:hypothetical protein